MPSNKNTADRRTVHQWVVPRTLATTIPADTPVASMAVNELLASPSLQYEPPAPKTNDSRSNNGRPLKILDVAVTSASQSQPTRMVQQFAARSRARHHVDGSVSLCPLCHHMHPTGFRMTVRQALAHYGGYVGLGTGPAYGSGSTPLGGGGPLPPATLPTVLTQRRQSTEPSQPATQIGSTDSSVVDRAWLVALSLSILYVYIKLDSR